MINQYLEISMNLFNNRVTVILNLWKRNHLDEQLHHLSIQTLKPFEVWIIQYEGFFEVKHVIKRYESKLQIHYFSISKNLKYFGRFSIANLSKSEYVWILDDDIIPGSKWLEHCIQKIKTYNSIVACSGRIIPKQSYEPEAKVDPNYFIGDCSDHTSNYLEKDTVVDFGIQSYLIKQSWLKPFWKHYPITFESGEDIHLAGSLKIDMDIGAIVPEQTCAEICGNLKLSYGIDDHASWRNRNFLELRKKCLHYLIDDLKWKPLLW